MKYKILKLLKESNDFVSGEQIGKTFDISRSAVWKNISKLKEAGYEINSVTNKGYKLNDEIDILNQYEIESKLKTKKFGKSFLCLNEIDSTNEEAKRFAQSEDNRVDDGFFVISEKQTKGKGRLGNNWINSDNLNLAFSIVLKPDLLPSDITSITLIAGLSICKAFRKLGIMAYLKWPNDIIINGKKAVGILTEISCEVERINYVIVGIGVNINAEKFDESISQKATSLFIETGTHFKRAEILNAILVEFEENYYKFVSAKSFSIFVKEYESCCLNIGKKIKAISRQGEIIGTAVGISENGGLIVKDDKNDDISIVSGEVSVRLQDGRYI